MSQDPHTRRLRALGRKRDRINAQRAEVLGDLRSAIVEAHGAGMRPVDIAEAAGITREAVRLALNAARPAPD